MSLLREMRVRRGWSQKELARRADLSQSHIARLETGSRDGTPRSLLALARALECTVDELLRPREAIVPARGIGREYKRLEALILNDMVASPTRDLALERLRQSFYWAKEVRT